MLVLEFGLIILTLNLDGANISLLFAFSFISTLPKTLLGVCKSVTTHETSLLRFCRTIKWEV